MCFFVVSATGVVGLCSTASSLFISIRKCYKADKKIAALTQEGEALLKSIEDLAERSSVFLDIRTIDKRDFCSIAGKIEKIKDELEDLRTKLKKKRNTLYRFISATESIASLESACGKLGHIETEMRLLITSARSDVKASVLIESFEPLVRKGIST